MSRSLLLEAYVVELFVTGPRDYIPWLLKPGESYTYLKNIQTMPIMQIKQIPANHFAVRTSHQGDSGMEAAPSR
jgi:hypothetical protein